MWLGLLFSQGCAPARPPCTPTLWWADADGDGAAGSVPVEACDAPIGLVAEPTDCDDAEPAAFPGAAEVCGDGIDNDCVPGGCRLDAELEAELLVAGDTLALLLGRSVATGDRDGDGIGDLLVGVPGDADSAGSAWLLTGPSGVLSAIYAADPATAPLAMAGTAVLLQDVDGDGRDEAILGAPANGGPGKVYVELRSGERVVLAGPGNGAGVGATLAGGDLDGDGIGDLVVGSLGDPDGRVFVERGPMDDRSLGGAWHIELGVRTDDDHPGALATGDLDGDGQDDLVVGDELAARYTVRLALRGGLESVEDADALLSGSGASVATGDFDGDGTLDLARTIEPGVVRVSTEALNAESGTDLHADGDFGRRLAAADLDGDGRDDLAVSVPGDEAASLLLAYGGVEDQALLVVDGGTRFGDALALGDTDGDGAPDLIVGAWQDDVGAGNGGAVYRVLGRTW